MDERSNEEERVSQENLIRSMTVAYHANPFIMFTEHAYSKYYLEITDGPPLPTSFNAACNNKRWSEAIDRDFEALKRRRTWSYIKCTGDMQPVPFKWTYRAKKLDEKGEEFLFKARCVLRGDLQVPYEDFEPDKLYEPVGTHESFRMILSFYVRNIIVLEGADVSHTYLNSRLNKPILMEQPTN